MVEGYKKSEIGVVPKEWDVKPFGDVFKILSNNTLSRDCLNYHSGSIKNIHYGDVLILFPEVLDCTRDDIPYINSDVSLTGMSLNEGDIIISDTAEDETVGKATEIYNKGDINVVSGLHTIPCRTIERKYTSGWWGYYINSKCFHDQLLPYIHGTKVSSIARDSLFKTFVVVPPIEEQKRIVKALRDIDRLIEQSEQLVNKYKLIKEGCLHVLFPNGENKKPEIRISGFDDDWKQRKLGDIATYKNGKGHEDNQSDEGTYELINLNSISIDGGLKPSGKYIEDGSNTLLENDLVMVLSDVGHGDLLGRVAIIPENNRFVLNQRVALLRINDDTNPYFLFSIINRQQDYFKKLGAGSSQLNISRGTVEDFIVDYPCQDEQRKIARYFQNLDNLITLHQRKVEKYKMIKQGMIENLMTGKVRLI